MSEDAAREIANAAAAETYNEKVSHYCNPSCVVFKTIVALQGLVACAYCGRSFVEDRHVVLSKMLL